jgi:hypothetical protein
MPFILQAGKLASLKNIRKEYETIKELNLDESPSWLGRPTFLGGTDVINRRRQILFLQKVHTVLQENLFRAEEITTATTEQEWSCHITAARTMLAAALYVKSQIGSSKRNSALYRLIEDDLGITKENYLDEEDEASCIYAARHLFVQASIEACDKAFDDANKALLKAKVSPFTIEEWESFKKFLLERPVKKIADDATPKYPITCITQKMFGAAFAYTGAAVGLITGDVVSRSTQALTSKNQLTVTIGSTLVVLGSAGPYGVALLAPVIAERLITAFCSISMAHILGMTMGMVGQGVGIAVGRPLDYASHVLWTGCKSLGQYAYPTKLPIITGTRIKDGVTVLCGIPIKALIDLPEDYAKMTSVEINSDGQLLLDGQVVTAPEKGIPLSVEELEKLRAGIEERTLTKAPLLIEEVDEDWAALLDEPEATELTELVAPQKQPKETTTTQPSM